MEQYKRVIAVEDEGDWYVIPEHLYEDFESLRVAIDLNKGIDDDMYYSLCDQLTEEFEQYQTGGDLNLTKLYIKDGE